MLITERTSDGRTIVRLHKDWHPGRIGIAYKPKQQPPIQPTSNIRSEHNHERK